MATAPIVLSARHALGQLCSEESLVLLLESTTYNDFNKEVCKYRVFLKYAVCFEIPLLGRKGKFYIHFFLDKEANTKIVLWITNHNLFVIYQAIKVPLIH